MNRPSRSLLSELLAFCLFMVALPSLLFLAWLSWEIRTDVVSIAEQRHQEQARSSAYVVEGLLQEPMKYLMWLGLTPKVREFIGSPAAESQVMTLQAPLDSFLYRLPQAIRLMAIHRQDGSLALKSSRQEVVGWPLQAHNKSWFMGALSELALTGTSAPLYLAVDEGDSTFLIYAMALQNVDNAIVGVAVMTVDIEELLGNSLGPHDSISHRSGAFLIGSQDALPAQDYVVGSAGIDLAGHPTVQWQIRVATPLEEVVETISTTRWFLLITMVFLLVITAMVISKIITRLLRPLTDLARWVREIQRDPHHATPILITGPSEVRDISHALVDLRTAVKLRELQLQQSTEHLRIVAEFAADWELWIHPDGHCLHCSPSAYVITGFLAERFLNDPELFWSIVDPRDVDGLRAAWHGLKETDVAVAEWRLVHPDGKTHWVEQVVRRVKGNEGQDLGWRATLRDVTVRRELETHLRHTHRVEELGRLAGGVAHDFNNLLSVIGGHAELLESLGGQQKSIRSILKAVERGAALTRQLLVLSRRQLEADEVVDLNVLLQEVLDLVRPTIGPEINLVTFWDLQAELFTFCPAADILQVLLNLINNARDAMPQGGDLVITAGRGADENVVIGVQDSGSGFNEYTIDRVFEPYFTTKGEGKGTGLGLAMAQAIIEASGGTISARNREDGERGAVFSISLPLCIPKKMVGTQSSSRRKAITVSQSPKGLQGMNVLVMEDNAEIAYLVKTILASKQASVFIAGDGIEGLHMAKNLERIDLIISDVRMPRMSGPRAVAEIHSLRGRIPTILMTGDGGDQYQSLHEIDGSLLILKPFTHIQLMQGIAEVLGDERPGAAISPE